MSPHLNYEIVRLRQEEIATRAANAQLGQDIRTTTNRCRSVKHRLVQVAAAIGVCVAAGTAVTVSDAHSNQRPIKQQHAGHVTAQQLAREIRAFEAKGYVPTSCTVSGTLMRNYGTGQSVTVNW